MYVLEKLKHVQINYLYLSKKINTAGFNIKCINIKLGVFLKKKNQTISTSVYSKPTEARLYLNVKSCHLDRALKNIPKSQFLRSRKLCSDASSYLHQSNDRLKICYQKFAMTF